MDKWRKWTPERKARYIATMKRKRDTAKHQTVTTEALKVIDAEAVIPASVGEEMLNLARLCVAKRVSDRAMIGLLVHYVHTFASVSE